MHRFISRLTGRWLVCVVLGAALLGCGGYLGRAKKAYNEGRYLESAERLEKHERDVQELSPRKQIDYGIYRGLSLMMLGDYVGAEIWLTYAREVAAQAPGEFTPNQKAALERGEWNLKQALQNAKELPRENVVAPPGVGTIFVPQGEGEASPPGEPPPPDQGEPPAEDAEGDDAEPKKGGLRDSLPRPGDFGDQD